MANGSISGSIINGNYKIRIDWSTIDNVANNTSKVKAVMYLVQASTWSLDIWSRACSIWIDGTEYTFDSPYEISNGGGCTTKLGTVTSNNIKHNTDGSKSVKISAEFNIQATISGTWYSKIEIDEKTIDLTTLPRATVPTLSSSSVNMGSKVKISTPRASSAFTHDLAYSFAGSDYVTFAVGVGESYEWTLPDLADKIPNASSGVMTIRCTTKNGSTTVGTKTVTLTVKVPNTEDYMPTIDSVTVMEAVEGLEDRFGAFVQHKSKIAVSISASGAEGSTIKGINTVFAGAAHAGANWTSDIISESGTMSLVTTVTDTRNRTEKKTTDITVLEYSTPEIATFEAYRCEEDGAESDTGEYLYVVYGYSAPSLNGGNTVTAVIQKKLTTNTNWETVHTLTDLSAEGYVILGGFSIDNQWDVRLLVTDYFADLPVIRQALIPSGDVIADIKEDGKGFAFFKVSERSGYVEIGGSQYVEGDQMRRGTKYSSHAYGISGSAGYIHMAQIAILGAYANAPITFVLTQRGQVAPMTVHIAFANADSTAPALSSFTYEGSDYGAYMVQVSDSVWDLYVQKAERYDHTAVQDWHMSPYMLDKASVTFPDLTSQVSSLPDECQVAVPAKLQSQFDSIYPIGSIYLNYGHSSPADMFGGRWERISNALLMATDAAGSIGQVDYLGETGGEEVTPYIQISVWRRTE